MPQENGDSVYWTNIWAVAGGDGQENKSENLELRKCLALVRHLVEVVCDGIWIFNVAGRPFQSGGILQTPACLQDSTQLSAIPLSSLVFYLLISSTKKINNDGRVRL